MGSWDQTVLECAVAGALRTYKLCLTTVLSLLEHNSLAIV